MPASLRVGGRFISGSDVAASGLPWRARRAAAAAISTMSRPVSAAISVMTVWNRSRPGSSSEVDDLLLEERGAPRRDIGRAGQAHGGEALAGVALDFAQHAAFARGDEQQRLALRRRAVRPDAVHILGVVRDVEVDDLPDVLHVEAARGHVGGGHDFTSPSLSRADDDLALRLVHVAMHGLAAWPRLQLFHQVGGAILVRTKIRMASPATASASSRWVRHRAWALRHVQVALSTVGTVMVRCAISTLTGLRR
jgi:hypothetical protein